MPLLGFALLLQFLLHFPLLQKSLPLLLESLIIKLKLLTHELSGKGIIFSIDLKLLSLYEIAFLEYFVDSVLPILLIEPLVL